MLERTYEAPVKRNDLQERTYEAPVKRNDLQERTYEAPVKRNDLGVGKNLRHFKHLYLLDRDAGRSYCYSCFYEMFVPFSEVEASEPALARSCRCPRILRCLNHPEDPQISNPPHPAESPGNLYLPLDLCYQSHWPLELPESSARHSQHLRGQKRNVHIQLSSTNGDMGHVKLLGTPLKTRFQSL